MLSSTNLKVYKPVDNFAFFINLFFLIFSIGLIFLHQKQIPSLIPFWFSKEWGVERLASKEFLWLIPGLIFLFFIGNNIISRIFAKNHFVIAKILVWASTFVALILIFSLYRIILVVI